jgi:hypothetical protein
VADILDGRTALLGDGLAGEQAVDQELDGEGHQHREYSSRGELQTEAAMEFIRRIVRDHCKKAKQR